MRLNELLRAKKEEIEARKEEAQALRVKQMSLQATLDTYKNSQHEFMQANSKIQAL